MKRLILFATFAGIVGVRGADGQTPDKPTGIVASNITRTDTAPATVEIKLYGLTADGRMIPVQLGSGIKVEIVQAAGVLPEAKISALSIISPVIQRYGIYGLKASLNPDGTWSTITVPGAGPIVGDMIVYRNGALMRENADYQRHATDPRAFTFAPLVGAKASDAVIVSFPHIVSGSAVP